MIGKKIKYIGSLILIICFLAFCYFQFQIIYHGINEKPKISDCIIVLGHSIENNTTPGNWLMKRLDKAYELYSGGYAPYIIVSGGKGDKDQVPVAEVMSAWLCSLGIPEDKILIENKSANTDENMLFSSIIADEYEFNSVIIVTNDFHVYRSLITARKFFDNVSASGAALPFEIHKLLAYLKEPFSLLKHELVQLSQRQLELSLILPLKHPETP